MLSCMLLSSCVTRQLLLKQEKEILKRGLGGRAAMPATTRQDYLCTHGDLIALQLQAEISSTLLHKLDDLIKLMRQVFTTSFQRRQ